MKTIFFAFTVLFLFVITSVTTAQSASIIWQQTVGGTGTDSMTAMSVGTNKTFVVCGVSKSTKTGNKSDKNYGGWDYWVVKMDFSGKIIWDKTFGGTKDDIATAIIATSDGGYLVGGTSLSDKSVTKTYVSFKGSADYWVIKLDANGNEIWNRTLGGIYTEELTSLAELPSGNFVVGGSSFSDNSGNKTSLNVGSENTADYWTLVLDPTGNTLAQSRFGGTSMDALTCLAATPNNSFYTAGYSYSLKYSGYKSELPVGNNDFWILRTDGNGVVQYEGGFGGSLSDYLTCMQVLGDGSLILGGYSNSPASGDKSGAFLGVTDYWLVKVKMDGTKQWDKTFGGALGDYLMSVQQTKDKGFILGGYSNSNAGNNKTQNSKGGNDYWIVKLDSLGRKQWDKTFGGSGDDKLTGIYEIDTNQFIVAGTSNSALSGNKTSGTVGNTGAADYWIMRLGNGSSLDKDAEQLMASLPSLTGKASFDITPDPVRNTYSIHYKTDNKIKADFVVYSANASVVLKTTLPETTSMATHSFSAVNLSKGTYYVVMYEGGKKVMSKTFVKE